MANDFSDAADRLKAEVAANGGFLTLEKRELRERFDIGKLGEVVTERLISCLEKRGLKANPRPNADCTLIRVYDLGTHIGSIARAVIEPDGYPETPLREATRLHRRAEHARKRESERVPWLTGFGIFLQFLSGRNPDDWERVDDDLTPQDVLVSLADSLQLPGRWAGDHQFRAIASNVSLLHPRFNCIQRLPEPLASTFDQARKSQAKYYDTLLREAALYLLEGDQIPSGDVDMGNHGLRFRREIQGELR